MVSVGTEGPSCLFVSLLVVLWGEAALGREALLSAFLVGAGSFVRELGVKVTLPPPPLTPPPTNTGTGKAGPGGSTVWHPTGAIFGRAAGLAGAGGCDHMVTRNTTVPPVPGHLAQGSGTAPPGCQQEQETGA